MKSKLQINTMKAFIMVVSMACTSLTSFSQENEGNDQINTLFGRDKITNGGYGAFGAGYSMINDRNALVMSGRGAWIINHRIAIGVAGSGFLNELQYDIVYDEDVNLTGGYGGLLIEPILFPKAPVHLSFPIIGAVGGIAYTRTSRAYNSWEYHNSWIEDTETFLLFEPGVEMELNVVRFVRLAFGVTYRITTDLELLDTSPDALEGLTVAFTLKFGKF